MIRDHTQLAFGVNVDCVSPVAVKCDMDTLSPEDIPLHLRRLRTRAGLSIAQMAHALGYKTASGYQRFEEQPRRKPFSLGWIEKLSKAVVGRGDPPVTREEVYLLRERPEREETVPPDPVAVELAAEIAITEFARAGHFDKTEIPPAAFAASRAIAQVATLVSERLREGEKSDDPQFRSWVRGLVQGLIIQSRQ